MNKPQKPQQGAAPGTPPVSHLDEKITQIIIDLGKFLKKIWLPAALVFAICLIGFLLYMLMGFIHGSKEDALVNRAFTLYQSKDSRAAKLSEKDPEIEQLIQDSRGSDSERSILKQSVAFLKSKVSKDSDLADLDSPLGPSPAAPEMDASQTEKAMARIEEYAKLGRERFPKDEDMQQWATGVLAWAKAEKEFKARALEKRSFAPLIPGGASGPGKTEAPPVAAPAPTPSSPPSPPAPPEGPKAETPPAKSGAQPGAQRGAQPDAAK